MYQFKENSGKYISLHDCRATGMSIGDRSVSFTFADGIVIGQKHPRNTFGRVLKSDGAQVEYSLPVGSPDENVNCYVFCVKKNGVTVRKQFSMKKLMHKLNDKGQQLEFVSSYKGGDCVVYRCVLWKKKKPYSRECQLIIRCDGVTYRWSELCPDKKV